MQVSIRIWHTKYFYTHAVHTLRVLFLSNFFKRGGLSPQAKILHIIRIMCLEKTTITKQIRFISVTGVKMISEIT